MQWKKVLQDERIYVPGINIDPGPTLAGKMMRVTIEEAVDECCEKWRGNYAFSTWNYGGPAWVCDANRIRPTFCPECGKRL
jgi:hypothetical protein